MRGLDGRKALSSSSVLAAPKRLVAEINEELAGGWEKISGLAHVRKISIVSAWREVLNLLAATVVYVAPKHGPDDQNQQNRPHRFTFFRAATRFAPNHNAMANAPPR